MLLQGIILEMGKIRKVPDVSTQGKINVVIEVNWSNILETGLNPSQE